MREARKVQKAGRSSYIVSLPISWIKANGIRKSAPVEMELNEDGTITIMPRPNSHSKKEERLVVEYLHPNSRTLALRMLIGGYIAGFNEMEIRPSRKHLSDARALASEFKNMVIGQEIVEETAEKITIRDISNPLEMPMQKTLKRMHYVSREILAKAVSSLNGDFAAGIEEAEAMENEVDRFRWLVARKHNIFLRYPSLASEEGIALPESNLYFIASRHIERISDHALSVLRVCSKKLKAFGKNFQLAANAEKCLSVYDKAIKALFEVDPVLANATIDSIISMEGEFDKLIGKELGKTEEPPAILYTALSLKRIADYSASICESTIDFSGRKKAGSHSA